MKLHFSLCYVILNNILFVLDVTSYILADALIKTSIYNRLTRKVLRNICSRRNSNFYVSETVQKGSSTVAYLLCLRFHMCNSLVIMFFCSLLRVVPWKGCLFVLRFYGPVNPVGSCRARSVYLTTRLLDRLSPLSG